jgi:hypothetical protein
MPRREHGRSKANGRTGGNVSNVARYDTSEARAKHVEEQRRYRLRNPARYNLKMREYLLRIGGSGDYKRRYRQNNPEKYSARKTLDYALRKGSIVRPNHCETCKLECKPHGHHADYSMPLEVKWLCRICHLNAHQLTARVVMEGDPQL